MKILLFCLINISVPFIIAKSSAFTCPKNHFSFNYDCYECSSCPPEISPSENECTEIWGLSADFSCAPGYRPPDDRNSDYGDTDKTSSAANQTTSLLPTVYTVPLTKGWKLWVPVSLVLAVIFIVALIVIYRAIKRKRRNNGRAQQTTGENENQSLTTTDVTADTERQGQGPEVVIGNGHINNTNNPNDLINSVHMQEQGQPGIVTGGVPY